MTELEAGQAGAGFRDGWSKEAREAAVYAAAKAVYDLDPFVTLGPDGEQAVSFEDAQDWQPTYYEAAFEVSAAAVDAFLKSICASVAEHDGPTS